MIDKSLLAIGGVAMSERNKDASLFYQAATQQEADTDSRRWTYMGRPINELSESELREALDLALAELARMREVGARRSGRRRTPWLP